MGNPCPAQQGGSALLSPSALCSTEASKLAKRVMAPPTTWDPPPTLLHLRSYVPISGQSLRFSPWILVGLPARLSWEQPALTGKWVSPGTSGIRHIW